MIGVVLGVLCSSTPLAWATVYGWKGEGGVWHLTNDPDAIPEAHLPSAQKFTSKFAGSNAVVVAEPAPPSTTVSTPVDLQLHAYERGLEQGLQTAERQVALAGELARDILSSVPRTPPPRIIIQQPGPTIIREVSPDYYPTPFYGFISPYRSFNWGDYSYPYGFRRLVPHSHFFPGSQRSLRSRRTGLFFSPTFRARQGEIFFPHGHSSHHGFISGRGFVVR